MPIGNPQGLSRLRYRVGTHNSFKENMLSRIPTIIVTDSTTNPNEEAIAPLSILTTRSDDDLIISLIDAWATVADVLTFYQEQIVNEGFPRTATERRSILELARAVGYELRPGVAANTFLAFTVDNTPETRQQRTIIATGIKVQSIPAQGELPQVFETIEQIEADPEWNELRPKLTEPQILDENTQYIYLKGDAQVNQGDKLLVQLQGNNVSTLIFGLISKISMDDNLKIPFSEIARSKRTSDGGSDVQPAGYDPVNGPVNVVLKKVAADLRSDATPQTPQSKDGWTQNDLVAFAVTNQLPRKKFFELFNYYAQQKVHEPVWKNHVYSFKFGASLFGHNAPAFETLSKEIRDNMQTAWNKKDPNWSWDDLTVGEYLTYLELTDNLIYLDNIYSGVIPDDPRARSWIVLQQNQTNGYTIPYIVSKSNEITLADFMLSTKVTSISLEQFTADPDTHPQPEDFCSSKLRKTTVYVQSEKLELAPDMPIPKNGSSASVTDDTVILDHVIDGLSVGQPISITGALATSPDDIRTEIAFIDDISLDDDKYNTKLTFKEKLTNVYDMNTMILNANVSRATHGETKREVIGSGDPSKNQQEFVLKQKPLTFTSTASKSGVNTSLKVYVDGVEWNEAPALSNLKHDDHAYIVRIDNDSVVHIIFGDGINGARPSAGVENITAKYRVGVGKSGMLNENQLKLLVDRPLGIRSVTNPTKPTDGDDPEKIESARQNASMVATRMGRLVALADFEKFVQSFVGVGKAQAISLSKGNEMLVYITGGSPSGEPLDLNTDLYKNLVKAICDSKDPRTLFYLDTFTPRSFSLEASVEVGADKDPKIIQSKIDDLLHSQFAYTSRQFGQSVTRNEIIASIQQVEGIIKVDVKYLYDSTKPESKDQSKDEISANTAYWDSLDNKFVRSDLLTIHPESGQNAVDVFVFITGENFKR